MMSAALQPHAVDVCRVGRVSQVLTEVAPVLSGGADARVNLRPGGVHMLQASDAGYMGCLALRRKRELRIRLELRQPQLAARSIVLGDHRVNRYLSVCWDYGSRRVGTDCGLGLGTSWWRSSRRRRGSAWRLRSQLVTELFLQRSYRHAAPRKHECAAHDCSTANETPHNPHPKSLLRLSHDTRYWHAALVYDRKFWKLQ